MIQWWQSLMAGLLACLVFMPFTASTAWAQVPNQVVEAEDARVTQSGAWTLQLDPVASGGAYLVNSGGEEDALSVWVRGNYFEVLYATAPHFGTLVVEIDGSVRRTIITTGAQALGGRAIFTNLGEGEHLIRVYAAAGQVIGVDAFAVTFPYATASPSAPLPTVVDDAALEQTPAAPTTCTFSTRYAWVVLLWEQLLCHLP